MSVNVYPARDTFDIGDTIWVENAFSAMLLNENNGKTYDVSNFDFQNVFNVTDLNSAFGYSYPVSLQVYEGGVTRDVVQSPNIETYKILYQNVDGQRRFRTAIVLENPGFCLLSFVCYKNSVSNSDEVDITECDKERLNLRFTVNNNGDNNFEMLKDAKMQDIADNSLERFQHDGGYCFYVK